MLSTKHAVIFFSNMILLAVFGFFASACVPSTEFAPLEETPTQTETRTLTSTPAPTRTPTYTSSPTPSLTATVTPAISIAKQTFIALSTAMQATDNAIPTVAKTPGHIDPNASCPLTPPPVGVFPYDVPGPFFSGDTIENRAVAKSAAGLYYEIWAGAPGDHPNQGLIRVFNDDPDMCASMAKGKLISQMRDYIAPNGPITLTEIVGDVIDYRLPGGKTGRFNFVTGAYMP